MPKPYRPDFIGLKQTISAGSQFDGAAPAASPLFDAAAEADGNRLRVWTAHTTGGLLDWNAPTVSPGRGNSANTNYWETRSLMLYSSASFSYTIAVSNGVVDLPWKNGGAVTEVFIPDEMTLPPGWFLKLVTTGATAAVTVEAYAKPGADFLENGL